MSKKILVGVKRVVDYAVKVRVAGDKKGVELNNIKMSMNPFCEIAVEEAIRLKENKVAGEIIAVTIGPKQATETLRTALAMGVDKGIHIETSARTDQEIQPLAVSKILANIAERDGVDIVMLGKQSIDGDNCQTGPMAAAFLGWPQCTFAAGLEVSESGEISAERETDSGTEKISIKTPSVITADLRLNEPRYATLPNIMKAKKKPIETIAAEDLGIDLTPRNVVTAVEEPPVRKAGITVPDVDTLIDKLKNEAGVIKS
jgi:electron transfer flavoprotein beta subunit